MRYRAYMYISSCDRYLGRYVSVLVELTRMEGTKHGQMIANQMLDVAIRVQAVRPFTVAQMVRRHYHIHLRTCTYVTVCTITAIPRTACRTCALFVVRRCCWRTRTCWRTTRNETASVKCSTPPLGSVANSHSRHKHEHTNV